MRKLLIAGFARLFRSNCFWELMLAEVIVAILAVCTIVDTPDWDSSLMMVGPLTAIAAAVLIPVFVSTEFADGTIRNKLIVGHGRGEIYLANLIVSAAGALCLLAAYSVIVSAGCLWFYGLPRRSFFAILTELGLSVLAVLAVCAVCSAVIMLSANKTAAVAVCILGLFISFSVSINLEEELDHSEYMIVPVRVDVDGEEVWTEELWKNPQYVSGMKRRVYQVICDLLPTTQLLADLDERSDIHAASSVGMVVFVSSAGIWVFSRKDLK